MRRGLLLRRPHWRCGVLLDRSRRRNGLRWWRRRLLVRRWRLRLELRPGRLAGLRSELRAAAPPGAWTRIAARYGADHDVDAEPLVQDFLEQPFVHAAREALDVTGPGEAKG
jgi:hypothetical protein